MAVAPGAGFGTPPAPGCPPTPGAPPWSELGAPPWSEPAAPLSALEPVSVPELEQPQSPLKLTRHARVTSCTRRMAGPPFELHTREHTTHARQSLIPLASLTAANLKGSAPASTPAQTGQPAACATVEMKCPNLAM